MTPWEEQMAFYGQAHRNPINITAHFIGVPTIVTGVLVAPAFLHTEFAGVTVHASWLVALGAMLYYLKLDKVFALFLAPILVALVLAANFIAMLPDTQTAVTLAAGGFVSGWVLQFLGHAVEGRKPALFQSLWKALLTAPMFLVAEVARALGQRREMFARVDAEVERMDRAEAPHAATTA
jgi:uncharacterized membrane protein YGL010W